MRVVFIFALLLITFSCQDSNIQLDSKACNILSMETFKGSPKSAHKFDSKCKEVEIQYTKELCQKALNGLIFGKAVQVLQEEFGEDIAGCFSIRDIEKFASESDKVLLKNKNRE